MHHSQALHLTSNRTKKVSSILLIYSLHILAACRSTSPADPMHLMQKLYTLPEPNFSAFYDLQQRAQFYTPRIVNLIAGKENCYRKTFNMTHLDFNYIVPGNDYNLSNLHIETLWKNSLLTKVTVRFNNNGDDVLLDYLLRMSHGQWRIDDVFIQGHSLSQVLSNQC